MENPTRAQGRKPDTAKGDLEPHPAGLRRAGRAENHRVGIAGGHPQDEPVGQRWGMVEPALWRRRHEGSTSSYQGVCGRHGGEDRCVTQGGLVSSKR
jgi:hypothetical protein